ncbi:MAG: class I SAM-dependent methyltransferase, partial [Ignavibacterium sp.]
KNYDKYYSISLNEFHFNQAINIFKKNNFPLSIRIADVGCGSAAILHYLKEKFGYCDVTGFDLNASNIEFARNFRGVKIENKDIYDLVGNEKFDLIITTENIEHVSKPVDYIDQIKTLLKPGGYLLLTTPHNDKTAIRLMGLSGDHFCAPNHQNYFNYQNLSMLIESHGFKVIDLWIDKRTQFNLYAFLKRFLIKRDQVTAFPPIKVSQNTIWKWQKNRDKSVITSSYNNIPINQVYSGIYNYNKNLSLKKRVKKFLGSIIPLYFKTHQILLARYNREN